MYAVSVELTSTPCLSWEYDANNGVKDTGGCLAFFKELCSDYVRKLLFKQFMASKIELLTA
jgi:hypothetical protein